ncbi:MAG: OadG family protein [Methylophaga sp.]|nr:OadG family protein [Methylophaga sp.]
MEEYSLLSEGMNLMLFGMGFVFVFLTLLVFATKLMSKLITKYEKNVGVIPDSGVSSPSTFIPKHGPLIEQVPTTKNSDVAVVSVITAAIHKFRSRK